jgi:hypothetical protein
LGEHKGKNTTMRLSSFTCKRQIGKKKKKKQKLQRGKKGFACHFN